MRARQLIEEGRAETEYPRTAEAADGAAPRPVQPGFEDAAPGMVPQMKEDPAPELDESPGGRFAKQLADLPEGSPEDTPGPAAPAPASERNPAAAGPAGTRRTRSTM
jgi:hypothetical protein